jgi:hypothetical protein
VGHIPAQRPGFRLRPALLGQLYQASDETPLTVLTGTWGVGKTQLAGAYARGRLEGGWRLVAWIDAQDSERLLAGLTAVADAVGLPHGGSQRPAADAGQAVRHWLEADGRRCLLVFDDAEDPDLLWPLVPAHGAARILITAAGESAAELGEAVPVDEFSVEDSLALLDGRTGLVDEAGAAEVAGELGRLPLALDQAGALIAAQHLGYASYLAKLRALPIEEHLLPAEERPYPPGAAEAVLLSLEAARAADPVGVCAGVMDVMAVLSPAAVGRDLLHAAGRDGTLVGAGRRVAAPLVDQALERLNEWSLLGFSLDGQAVVVHRLVASVVRHELARQGRLRAAAAALESSAQAPAAGQAAEAIPRLEQTLVARERLLGPGHSDTLRSRSDLAAAYRKAGRIADAIPLVEQVLVAREWIAGPDHPSTMAARNNLAVAYRDAGRAAQAVPLFERNLAACEALLGGDHPRTRSTRRNLALAREEAARAGETGRPHH